MTNAATGNPMIPQHPSIQAQHAQAAGSAPSGSNGQAAPATPAPNTGADIDWAAMAMGLEDESGNPPPQNPQTQQQAPQGQQPQGEPSAAGPELTIEQKLAVAQAAQEATPGQPQQPATPQQQMSEEQAVQTAVQHLLGTTYKLTDEQKKQLVSEPDVAIPQLAAQMHVTIATQLAKYMQQAMAQMVPQMAVSAMQRQMGAFRAEQTFFGQYPALNRPEFKPVVLQSLKLAKAMTPNATREQIMKDAAELAAFKLKIQLGQGTPQQAAQQPQRPAALPHTPAQMPAPFVPAVAGAPAQAQQGQQQQDNIFAQLASETDW